MIHSLGAFQRLILWGGGRERAVSGQIWASSGYHRALQGSLIRPGSFLVNAVGLAHFCCSFCHSLVQFLRRLGGSFRLQFWCSCSCIFGCRFGYFPVQFLRLFWWSFWCGFCHFPLQILRSLGGCLRLHSGAVFAAFLGQFVLLSDTVFAVVLV